MSRNDAWPENLEEMCRSRWNSDPLISICIEEHGCREMTWDEYVTENPQDAVWYRAIVLHEWRKSDAN